MVRKLDPYHTTVSSSWYQKEFQDSVDVDIPQWYHGHCRRHGENREGVRRKGRR